MRFNLFVLYFSLMFSISSNGQNELITPAFSFLDLRKDVPIFKCPPFDIDRMIENAKQDLKAGVSPFVFAKKFSVDITPYNSGIWEEKNGLMVWRLQIKSENAYSMMLLFKELKLPPFSSLFIYDENRSYVMGPYTENYSANKVLASPLIPGSLITVELQCQKDFVKSPPFFRITNVSHDYSNVFGFFNPNAKRGIAGDIADCEIDIACSLGDPWQIQKRAVARIVLDCKALCTGALINNTLSDGTSYFLTADHCIDDNADAADCVFYFNYESPFCNGGDGQTQHVISGAQRRAFRGSSDFSLLQLNVRIPSSFQPFFAGWDRSGAISNRATVIHHPLGNTKKIAIDNDPIEIDSLTWVVTLDVGTAEPASSGAPLFDENGKIIGQLWGGYSGCPDGNQGIQKQFGKFDVSWNNGNNSAQRLRDWLGPNNNAPIVMEGFAPHGWLNNWVIAWDAPDNQNVYNSMKAISVGEGNQVFYRGKDNKVHTMYFSNGSWHHDWINGWDAPANENIFGDIVVGGGNQIFYRGTDGKMHSYYWWDNAWHHAWLGGPSNHNISIASGSIAVGEGNRLFYRGVDNKMQTYFFSNGNWYHDWINGWDAPANENISGDIVVGGGNQIFYRGTDGKMHSYYWWDNAWHHAWLGGPSNHNISIASGSIAVGEGNRLFYRGVDNKIQTYFFSNGNWHHDWINGYDAPANENISGDIEVGEGNRLSYRGADGRMHIYTYSNNDWTHDWIEGSSQAPSVNNVAGAIAMGTFNQTFYRGTDGRCKIYYFEQEFILRTSQPSYNYTMFETKPSPTIPERDKNMQITINAFPNPAKDILNVRVLTKQVGTLNFSLFDVTGKMVQAVTSNNLETTVLNLRNIPSGLFILKVQDSMGNVVTKKVIKTSPF